MPSRGRSAPRPGAAARVRPPPRRSARRARAGRRMAAGPRPPAAGRMARGRGLRRRRMAGAARLASARGPPARTGSLGGGPVGASCCWGHPIVGSFGSKPGGGPSGRVEQGRPVGCVRVRHGREATRGIAHRSAGRREPTARASHPGRSPWSAGHRELVPSRAARRGRRVRVAPSGPKPIVGEPSGPYAGMGLPSGAYPTIGGPPGPWTRVAGRHTARSRTTPSAGAAAASPPGRAGARRDAPAGACRASWQPQRPLERALGGAWRDDRERQRLVADEPPRQLLDLVGGHRGEGAAAPRRASGPGRGAPPASPARSTCGGCPRDAARGAR